ncbi:MAG: hypothetical protein CVV44_12580 [Spirochaetae bacterium HGW-Spirochaetae-1]|jgi:hypothetical protein|nr:MAG: hypothetical protein CVV44_12580 [Spirochaetae bacterium HGW-Spirochaetae-1]
MSDEKNELSAPMRELVQDLGINPDNAQNLDLGDIFKTGTSPMLFLTRVSNVYTHSHHLEKENSDLKKNLNDYKEKLDEAKSQIVALQKSEIILQKDNEYLSTVGQNSIPGTILFSMGSVFIGVCGGYINAKTYLPAFITGLIGLGCSVLAGYLINQRPKKGLIK